MDYNELYNEYTKLLQENRKLRTENEDFRKQLGLQMPEFCIDNDKKTLNDIDSDILIQNSELGEVSNSSSPEEKISLFISLFKGRDDVYAKRWQNRDGKSGYSPVCINEWIKGICDKPQIKCSECKNRKYSNLDTNAIDRHLRGIEILGIYPMNTDETCYFLAIDFDDDGWEQDIFILREICDEKKVAFAVERSRSGNGAHLWFFFKEKITAVAARKFGTSLLTYAMTKRHEIKFKSYDRLFPNQDTIPKGGLGNLIALPMQKRSRMNKNSVFIDKNFQPYKDQWSFLSSIGRLRKEEIDYYTSEFCLGNELGNLKEVEEEIIKPWEKSKENNQYDTSDFPNVAHIIKANMIFICKKGFSNKALNSIKRMAAFKNPEFYKAQVMRLPTFDKPRVISLDDETDEYLGIPRGCEIDLFNFLNTNKINFECDDKTYIGKAINVEFNGKLRKEQAKAVEALLKYDNGVLSATTAFGKTVIGANLITEIKANTLIIVHTQQLLEQWKERLNEFLIINEVLPVSDNIKRGRKKNVSLIGQIGAGKNRLSGIIDIATMQSLVRDGEVKEKVSNVIVLTGGMSAKEKRFQFEKLSGIPKKSSMVIVATGKFIGEGFDEPRLDTLFLAMPISWKGTLQQYAGRLHRLYENKNEVQIYDYVDVHVGVLERMYQKRLRGYASIGYSAKSDSETFEIINSIYDNKNFYTVFSSDILSAKRNITIVSPFISKRRLMQMLELLRNALRNKISIRIITRPNIDFKEKDKQNIKEMHECIKAEGINLILKSNIHQKFSIIDEKIVWYGSINLLSYGSAVESIMRLSSINISNELLGTL